MWRCGTVGGCNTMLPLMRGVPASRGAPGGAAVHISSTLPVLNEPGSGVAGGGCPATVPEETGAAGPRTSWQLLTGHDNGQVLVWDAARDVLAPVCKLGEPGSAVRALGCLDPWGLICSAHANGEIALFSRLTGGADWGGPHGGGVGGGAYGEAATVGGGSGASGASGGGLLSASVGIACMRPRRAVLRAHRTAIAAAGACAAGVVTASSQGSVKLWRAAELAREAERAGLQLAAPRRTCTSTLSGMSMDRWSAARGNGGWGSRLASRRRAQQTGAQRCMVCQGRRCQRRNCCHSPPPRSCSAPVPTFSRTTTGASDSTQPHTAHSTGSGGTGLFPAATAYRGESGACDGHVAPPVGGTGLYQQPTAFSHASHQEAPAAQQLPQHLQPPQQDLPRQHRSASSRHSLDPATAPNGSPGRSAGSRRSRDMARPGQHNLAQHDGAGLQQRSIEQPRGMRAPAQHAAQSSAATPARGSGGVAPPAAAALCSNFHMGPSSPHAREPATPSGALCGGRSALAHSEAASCRGGTEARALPGEGPVGSDAARALLLSAHQPGSPPTSSSLGGSPRTSGQPSTLGGAPGAGGGGVSAGGFNSGPALAPRKPRAQRQTDSLHQAGSRERRKSERRLSKGAQIAWSTCQIIESRELKLMSSIGAGAYGKVRRRQARQDRRDEAAQRGHLCMLCPASLALRTCLINAPCLVVPGCQAKMRARICSRSAWPRAALNPLQVWMAEWMGTKVAAKELLCLADRAKDGAERKRQQRRAGDPETDARSGSDGSDRWGHALFGVCVGSMPRSST